MNACARCNGTGRDPDAPKFAADKRCLSCDGKQRPGQMTHAERAREWEAVARNLAEVINSRERGAGTAALDNQMQAHGLNNEVARG